MPGRLFGLGKRTSIVFWGKPNLGAAEIAPTAPHATPSNDAEEARQSRRTGPAKFWSTRRIRVALVLASIVSVIVHGWVTPWSFLPDTSGLEAKNADGELTIPIDLLGEEPPPEEKPPPQEQIAPDDPNGPNKKKDAGPPKVKPDASIPDAEATSALDATALTDLDGGALPSVTDGSAPTEAGADDASSDAGLLANAGDASTAPGASGPRDPGAMIGMPGLISAGTVNVTLLVNIAVIRQNPVGARMGPLLQGIPQWADFMKGSSSAVDPVRDTDWILIYGPSLIHTDRDAVIVHYAISDTVVDNAIDSIAKRYDKGGAFDAGVPGVKASLGHADNAERVFIRGQPHVLVIVPKDKAKDFAMLAKRATINPRVRPGEALRLTVKDPWKQISIKGLKFNESVKEIRLWIVPRPGDGGADIYAEGDCTDEAGAIDAADALTDLLKRQNSVGARIATRGLLNNAKVEADGTHIKSHLSASKEQLEAILNLVAAILGVNVQSASP